MAAEAKPVAWPSTELREELAAQRESAEKSHTDIEPEEEAREENFYPELVAAPPRTAWDALTWVLGVAVLACVLLMGISVGRHMVAGKRTAQAHSTTPSSAVPTTAQPVEQSAPASNAGPVPSGGLVIFQDGKEVFRATPPARGNTKNSEMQQAAAIEPENVVQLPPSAVEESLVERIEPDYPQAARQQKIQGPVVLDVHIATDGRVQDVSVVSGADPLAQASTAAVKRWRFKPQVKNGRAVEAETRVTLNFRLPG
jgi:TonB family protein